MGAVQPLGESPRHRAKPGGPPPFNKGGERANHLRDCCASPRSFVRWINPGNAQSPCPPC